MKSKAAPIVLCGLLFLCLFQLSVGFNSYYKGEFSVETFSSSISNLATILFVSAILLVASVAIFCKTNNRFVLYIFAIFAFICYWVFWRNYCEYSYNYEFKFWDLFLANFLQNMFNPTIIIFVLFIVSTTSLKKKIEYNSLTSRQINAMLCIFFFALTLIFANREFGIVKAVDNVYALPWAEKFNTVAIYSKRFSYFFLMIFIYLLLSKNKLNIYTPIVIIFSFICLYRMSWYMEFAYERDVKSTWINLTDIDKAQIFYLLTFLILCLSALTYYGLQIYKLYKTVVESKTKLKSSIESQIIPGYELLSDDDKIKAQDYIRQILERKKENSDKNEHNVE